jgi:hypothetical protein
MQYQFSTDGAALCVYDLGSLRDRIDDVPDWWCTPWDEVDAANDGSLLIFGLSDDGVYQLDIHSVPIGSKFCFNLKAPSGTIFFGSSDEVTGGGFEPNGGHGGCFLEVSPGSYVVEAQLDGSAISVAVYSGGNGTNEIGSPINLHRPDDWRIPHGFRVV